MKNVNTVVKYEDMREMMLANNIICVNNITSVQILPALDRL